MVDVKTRVQELLNQLPSDCTLEDVQYRLYVLQTIEKRLSDLDSVEKLTQDEAERRLAQWLHE